MSQKFVLVKRKNVLKPTEPEKFYAIAVSNGMVETGDVIRRVSERSSYSQGELEGMIKEFLLEVMNVLEKGNTVRLGELGCFHVTICNSNPVVDEKKFSVATCIKGSHVRFMPGRLLKKMCKSMEYSFRHPEEEEGKPTDGGKPTGDGSGEAPDPIG